MTTQEDAAGLPQVGLRDYLDRLSPAHVSLFLRCLDLFMVGVAGAIAYLLASSFRDEFAATPGLLIGPVLVGMVVAAFSFNYLHCYWRSNYLSRYRTISRLTVGWTLAFCALAIMGYLIKASADYSRVWAVIWFFTSLALLSLGRLAVDPLTRGAATDGRLANRVLLIGRADKLRYLREKFAESGDGLHRLTDTQEIHDDLTGERPGILGSLDRIKVRIAAGEIDKVVFVADRGDIDILRETVAHLTNTSAEMLVVGDPLELQVPAKSVSIIWGVPMLVLLERPIAGWQAIMKRGEDVAVAGAMLFLLAPLLALIAIAVRVSGPGPILFRQPRFGVDGRVFEVYKFRTMHHRMTDMAAEQLTLRRDPRVTAVGRVLRKTSLDELPQLLNVMRGEMSIVGPRPHALAAKAGGQLYEEVYEAYMARHRVRPGITGWAQVNGWRGETETEGKLIRRVEYDLQYIEKWSLLFDLYIIFLTPFSLVRYRDVF